MFYIYAYVYNYIYIYISYIHWFSGVYTISPSLCPDTSRCAKPDVDVPSGASVMVPRVESSTAEPSAGDVHMDVVAATEIDLCSDDDPESLSRLPTLPLSPSAVALAVGIPSKLQ